jgi:alpha-L-fucosidase
VGPHIDFVGELTKAVRAQGLRMGLYYSLYEWFNPIYLSDVNAYVSEHMIPQIKDIVQTYKPDVLWTDGEWNHPESVWKSEKILEWLFNKSDVNETIAVNDRWGKKTRGKHGGYYTTEYFSHTDKDVMEGKSYHPWEECRGIGDSFGYNRNERLSSYSSPQELVHMLVTIVSRGGNLLLDIGPTGDGRIPVIMEERLSQLGDWLKVNGEAIYGSNRWDKLAEDGDKVCYTSKDEAVYAIALNWPQDLLVLNISKPSSETVVNLLGYDKQLSWKYKDGKMIIDTSEIGVNDLPCQWAYTFKIKGDVEP